MEILAEVVQVMVAEADQRGGRERERRLFVDGDVVFRKHVFAVDKDSDGDGVVGRDREVGDGGRHGGSPEGPGRVQERMPSHCVLRT